MPLLHLDFETFSELSLPDVGAHRYLAHQSTEILLTGWALDDGDVRVEEGCPTFLLAYLEDPDTHIVAFNAEFERLVIHYLLHLNISPERYICTMARAWSLSFTGNMENVCKQMELPQDKQKLARAKRMMQKFTKPRRPSKNDDRTRWTPDMDPEGWGEFREYAAQDVVASREIHALTAPYPWAAHEHEMWCVDQLINDEGWPLDMALVHNANRIRKAEESKLRSSLKSVTGLDNPNSVQQLGAWLTEQGYPLPNLQKETVEQALTNGMVGPAREALLLRQQLARATPKKWAALERAELGSTIKASLEFAAGSRTQRWGGRIFQPQNLYTERVLDVEVLAEILTYASRDTVEALYGDVMDALSGGIRSSVTAPEGKKLVVADLSSIESRLVGYHSGEERINGLFRRGEDTYKDLASRIFGKPVESITKAERTFAKPPELGAAYMLSGRGLVGYAAGMGVDIEEDEAKRVISIWRESNPAVVQMWNWFKAVVHDVVLTHSTWSGYGVTFRRDDRFMFIDLPSGRSIYYFRPLIQSNDWGQPSLSYMGRYQDEGGKWQRVFTHPGKITENIIQAVARDILRDAMLKAWKTWLLPIIGHVHDEIVCCVPDSGAEGALHTLTDIMSTTPSWAPGLLLDAEGFVTQRYKKG